jgi:hypothetical protein
MRTTLYATSLAEHMPCQHHSILFAHDTCEQDSTVNIKNISLEEEYALQISHPYLLSCGLHHE